MGGSSPEVLTRRHKGQQPVGLTLYRGEKKLQRIHVQLIDPDEGSTEPFKVVSAETGEEVQLQQKELLFAYASWGLPAPESVTRGVGISYRIAERKFEKKNQKPVLAKSAEALDTLVRDN